MQCEFGSPLYDITTGYIIQWWVTQTLHWDGLSQYMCEKLFHFIWMIQCFNFLKKVTKLKAWVCRCIQDSFQLWEPYHVVQGWLWGNESQSKMLINLCLFQTITASNSVMHIATIIIFGEILEGVGPIYNWKKFWLCGFRCQSKSGITGFSTHLHYSILYKTSQVDSLYKAFCWWLFCVLWSQNSHQQKAWYRLQVEDVVLWVTHHCII